MESITSIRRTSDHRRKSNFTEDIEKKLRQGLRDTEAVGFIFPSKERYCHYKGEGSWLKVVMTHPAVALSKSRSKWEDFRSLSKWGWQYTILKTRINEHLDGIRELISNSEGIEYTWVHVGEAFFEGPPTDIRWPCTHATYINVLYPEKGVILSMANFSPEHMIKEGHTPLEFQGLWDSENFKPPELGRWSDIIYLSWKEETTEEQRANLNKIVQHDIMNMETRNMIAYILRSNFKHDTPVGRAPRWPEKRVIDFTMEGFDALL